MSTSTRSRAASAEGWVERRLLDDGAVGVRASAATWPIVSAWLPRFSSGLPHDAEPRAWIRVESGPPTFAPPAGPPRLELRAVAGWFLPDGTVLLREPGGRVSAVVDPAGLRADVRLQVTEEEREALGPECFAALLLCAALLLGRLGRTIVHAAAVVGPDQRAWLIAGGTFSGKTTSCVNLVRHGWDYLSDDLVVLGPTSPDGVQVEGWPRAFNLDDGYLAGRSVGTRRRVDTADFGPGRWRSRATLGGIMFSSVTADQPTHRETLRTTDALTRLLRQSPWLLADPGSAAGLLALLTRAASGPTYALGLGRDCYIDPGPLDRILRQIVEIHPHSPVAVPDL